MVSPANLHHRRSLRLQGYDYTQPGAYFVTLCTHNRECLFGEIVDGVMQLNDAGSVTTGEWFKTAQIRENVHLHADEFVVMPNHVHGILWIVDAGVTLGHEETAQRVRPAMPPNDAGATRRVERTMPPDVGATRRVAPTAVSEPRPTGPASGSVGAVMAQFKSAVTKRINALRGTTGMPVWQRSYHEHIVRNDESLNRIREYIANNPLQWALDRENPANPGTTRGRVGRRAE